MECKIKTKFFCVLCDIYIYIEDIAYYQAMLNVFILTNVLGMCN